MFSKFLAILQAWSSRTGERQKLQHAYLALIVVLTLVAGLISLVNSELGHRIMVVVLAAVIAFGANAVVWNLLNSSIVLKITSHDKPRTSRRQR